MLPAKLQQYPKIAGLLIDNPDHVSHYANLAKDALENLEKVLTDEPQLYEMMLKNKLAPLQARMSSDAPDQSASLAGLSID